MNKRLWLSRGEIWYVALDPVVGHEQAKTRPCVVISNDAFNQDASGLCVIIPMTSQPKNNLLHILVKPSESGLKKSSYVLCDQVRTVSQDRFEGACVGLVSPGVLELIEYALRVLLELR
jgi:mRNA interferase MazF